MDESKMKINNVSALLVFILALASTMSIIRCDEKVHSHVIPVPDLGEFVNKEEGRNFLKAEYHNIPTGMRQTAYVGLSPENKHKNRYDDLPAFDDTRVVLERLPEDPYSDYINANYVDGYNRIKEYVATQGPLPNTINDFWRMIWQLNATKIIMLANIIEHGKVKVEKYWPEGEEDYGKIHVIKMDEVSIGDEHVVRTFSLEKEGVEEKRVLRHFHFTGWPDMGVPSNRLTIVALLQQARKYRSESTVPIVVHCSAGVGRTGTVILTDSMLEKARSEQMVDFPKRLDRMRDQRIEVVEKEEQYIFAHEAVHDVFNVPDSSDYLNEVDEAYKTALERQDDNDVESRGSSMSGSVLRVLNPLGYL